MTNPIIDIRNMNYIYGRGALAFHALKDIHFTMRAGEIVIMTGPSGSGKTTLLTLIGALRRSQSGLLEVMSQDLTGASERTLIKTRLKTGYIFQHHNLFKSLTALQNVCLSLELRPQLRSWQRHRLATKMLSEVGLANHLHHRPDSLSGGQKQRVAVARALVAQPRLILADEPTASLDKVSGQETVNILKSLAREKNTAILLVTHDYRILDIADRIVYLEDGQIKDK